MKTNEKHLQVVKRTKRITLLSISLMVLVQFIDRKNYTYANLALVLALASISTAAVAYRIRFEIKHGIFVLQKQLPAICFLLLSIIIFIAFWGLE